MTQLSDGTGTAETGREKVMVRVQADGTPGGKTDLVDLTAFKSVTKQAEQSERSPSNSANTIMRIAKRYESE